MAPTYDENRNSAHFLDEKCRLGYEDGWFEDQVKVLCHLWGRE
jgi:hypothetical protein